MWVFLSGPKRRPGVVRCKTHAATNCSSLYRLGVAYSSATCMREAQGPKLHCRYAQTNQCDSTTTSRMVVKKKNGFGGWSWQTRSLPGLPALPGLDPKSLTRDRAVLFIYNCPWLRCRFASAKETQNRERWNLELKT